MSASSIGSEHREGVIRVVPETTEIVAVCVEGEFDVANVTALREQVDGQLASENDLILDLSQATFIDSSVIRVLFDAAGAVKGRDQAVVLQLGTTPIVERALEIVGIEGALPRAHNREEAVRMIRARRGS
jgi:anti-anti-sigma factor